MAATAPANSDEKRLSVDNNMTARFVNLKKQILLSSLLKFHYLLSDFCGNDIANKIQNPNCFFCFTINYVAETISDSSGSVTLCSDIILHFAR